MIERDAIVDEIHRVRKKMFHECGGDLDKYLDRIQVHEAQDRDRLVSQIARPETRAPVRPK